VPLLQRSLTCSNAASSSSSSMDFWLSRLDQYDKLAPVALDILSAPASESFQFVIFLLLEEETEWRSHLLHECVSN
jgi:hypothetical protein